MGYRQRMDDSRQIYFKRMIGITEEHIEELSDIATLMTEEEVKEFMEYEYAGGEK